VFVKDTPTPLSGARRPCIQVFPYRTVGQFLLEIEAKRVI